MALAVDKGARVAEVADSGSWASRFRAVLSDQRLEDFLRLLFEIPPVGEMSGDPDHFEWADGKFSVKRAYRRLSGGLAERDEDLCADLKIIWAAKIPTRVKVFLWCMRRDRLCDKVRRGRLLGVSDLMCDRCEDGAEDADHIFFGCGSSASVWDSLGSPWVQASDADHFWRSIRAVGLGSSADVSKPFAALWAIWLGRNDTILRGNGFTLKMYLHTRLSTMDATEGEQPTVIDTAKNKQHRHHHHRNHGSTSVFVIVDYIFLAIFFCFLCFFLLQLWRGDVGLP